MIKTSKLLCMIVNNESEIETSKINYYLKELVKIGYLEVHGTKIRLTQQGKQYVSRRESNEK